MTTGPSCPAETLGGEVIAWVIVPDRSLRRRGSRVAMPRAGAAARAGIAVGHRRISRDDAHEVAPAPPPPTPRCRCGPQCAPEKWNTEAIDPRPEVGEERRQQGDGGQHHDEHASDAAIAPRHTCGEPREKEAEDCDHDVERR